MPAADLPALRKGEMKERRACPECGGDMEKGWVPGAWYCPVCGDVVTFDGDADEDSEEGP